MDIWHTCEPEKLADEGWVGRAIRDLDPKKENVLTGVNFGRGLPRAMAAPGVPVASVGNLETYGVLTSIEVEEQRAEALDIFSRMYSPAMGHGPVVDYLSQTGMDEGEFNRPTDVAVDNEGLIYVADWDNDRVQVFDGQARFITVIIGDATLSKWGETKLDANPEMRLQREIAQGLEREKYLRGPIGVVVDDQDRLFIVDSQRNRIQIYRKLAPYFLGRWDGGRL